MNKAQQKKFQSLYQKHVNALKRQGKSQKTVDAYSRAVRRITEYFDICPDRLNKGHLESFFDELIRTHSWSTVKLDRNGLQFFYKHVLNRQWDWIDIVKPPQVKSLPDILTPSEIERVINCARELRYQTYILTVYSMGLRLGEALNLKVGDIDADRKKVHIRAGKGLKDRYVTLPEFTLQALRRYWATHRHPELLFPGGRFPKERNVAETPMDRGGLQKSFKAIIQSCGIHKRITIHSLRHCFGTHLTEKGLNLRAIQQEMGHQCPKTTARYTQLSTPVQQCADDLINALCNDLSLRMDGEV